jgi:predicted HTH transcriptional regulator
MLEELLARQESKTLEFKERAKSLHKIVQTLIAFANTAGGTLVIGIQDKTKNVIGVDNILQDEERITSAVADSVSPTLLPNLQFISWRDKDVRDCLQPSPRVLSTIINFYFIQTWKQQ